MSKQFITFGAGEKNYIDAGKRLLKQANNLNLFDKTILYTDEFLKKDTCPSFYFRTGDICCPAPLINGKCVTKSNILNRINGLPICALNFEAANTFSFSDFICYFNYLLKFNLQFIINFIID